MTIYTGRSADGSDMQEAQGVYLSPDGNEWSTEPYPEMEFKVYHRPIQMYSRPVYVDCQKVGHHNYIKVTQTASGQGSITKVWLQCKHCGFMPEHPTGN